MTTTETTTRSILEVAMTITHHTEHGLACTYIEMPDLPGLLGKLTTTRYGSSYLILDLATGHNTHPGTRVDNSKSESELLAAMAEEMITHLV